jgi:hypothetical protein
VELANAMLMSTFIGASVALPIDGERYAHMLAERSGG